MVAASGAVCAAVVCRLFSIAPGWRDQRLFSYVALSAAAYAVLDVSTDLGHAGPWVIACARTQLFVGALHVVAWLRYAAVHLARTPQRWERWYERALLAGGALGLLPGFAYTDKLRMHAVRQLGFTYAEPVLTTCGGLLLVALLSVFALLAGRYLMAWRRGAPHAAAHFAGLCLFLLMGLNDAAIVAFGLDLPYLLAIGFIVPVGAVTLSVTGRFAADARDLASLRQRLESMVDERTRALEQVVVALRDEAAVRQRAERALRESEERFRLAFKSSPDAIAVNRASDGLYVAANDGFMRITGYTEDEVIGRSSIDLGVWANPADRQCMVEAVLGEGAAELETHFRRKDGTLLVGAMLAKLIQLDELPHILTVTRDVTRERQAADERRRLVDDLRQAQKMEAIGRLAGGVAHDFNNLLTGITANVGLALLDGPASDPNRQLLEEIQQIAKRAAGVTRQLLTFSRRQPLARKRIVLNEILRDMERLLGRVIGEDVRLELTLAPDVPEIHADTGQIEQVLVNLVLNARDALLPGGGITLETRAAHVHDGGPEQQPGPYAVVTVRDEGHGMDAATRSRLFEPFFTTKPRGRGTGLGLSTVYGIVRNHGGFIVVESEPDRGSAFSVHLPAAQGAAPETRGAVVPPDPTAPGGGETVLLVEDEASVREGIRNLLVRLGYRVLVASDGAEALASAAAHGARIDLLVTDVVMPRMNGGELAARLRIERPETRVLFISGYDDAILEQHGFEGARVELLEKPFTLDALASRVRSILSAAHRGTAA